MRTIVIVQARMTSSRLPGKMMMDLCGKPVLQHVLERAKGIPGKDAIVLTVPNAEQSSQMIKLANSMGIAAHVGSEFDVLERFHGAAVQANADIVVRVTGDCPMLDREVCGRVISLRQYKNSGYASNVLPRSFPKGLDCECFTMEQLARANKKATDTYDREHVTPFIIRANDGNRTNLASGRFDLARMRWTLDTIKDLKFMREVFSHAEPRSMEHALQIIESYNIVNKETEAA